MATNPAQISEIESYMLQKGVEYRTIDKARAGRIYERLKAHIAPPKRTIQVLGTNGKGSTGRFLALMLMQNGARVLHFTSPHIFSFSERFYKNGAIISDDELTNAHRFLQGFDFMVECSYFEYATFLALALAQGVDYLILEAGVGGELDSTSVIARDLCIFSVIDYDHTEILGESIEEIATTKLNAVFYPNLVPKMVLGAQKYEIVEKIAKEIAKEHSIEIFTLDSANSQNLVQNNRARSAHLESRPLRGAKNQNQASSSGKADFLLEAEKRGSPPKSEKRQLLGAHFKKVGGSGVGGAALLRKESNENNGNEIAESIRDSSPTAQNDKIMDCHADSANLLAMTDMGGLPRRFCEYASNDEFIRDSSPTAQNDKFRVRFAESTLDSANQMQISHAPHFLSQNLALALKALEVLGLKCDLKTLPPLDLRGRFEQIAPNIIIDVGHNQNAALALKQNLGQKKVILVYNSYFQKNIRQILETLKGNVKSVQILRICDNPRIIKQEILEQILENLNIPYQNFDGAKSIKKDENYLVFGSFSVVEAFLRDYEASKAGMKF